MAKKLRVDIGTTGAEKAKRDVKGLESSIANTAKTVLKAASAIMVMKKGIDFLNQSVKAAMEQEQIFVGLANAIEITGKSWKEAKPELDAYFTRLQALTKYGDTDTAKVFQQLITLTSDYDKAMTGLPIALDLASSGLFDVNTAARYVGMALTGNIEMLGRYIAEFKTTTNEMIKNMDTSEKIAYALDVLREKFGGLAEKEMKSANAQLAQMNNYWVDFTETIGDFWIPTITKATEKLLEFMSIGFRREKEYATLIKSTHREFKDANLEQLNLQRELYNAELERLDAVQNLIATEFTEGKISIEQNYARLSQTDEMIAKIKVQKEVLQDFIDTLMLAGAVKPDVDITYFDELIDEEDIIETIDKISESAAQEWLDADDRRIAEENLQTLLDNQLSQTQEFATTASNFIYEAFGGQFDNIENMWENLLKRMWADLIASGILYILGITGGTGLFGGGGLLGGLNIFGGGGTQDVVGGGNIVVQPPEVNVYLGAVGISRAAEQGDYIRGIL